MTDPEIIRQIMDATRDAQDGVLFEDQQGSFARQLGEGRESNPFEAGTPPHKAWLHGWNRADEREAQKAQAAAEAAEDDGEPVDDWDADTEDELEA